MPETYDLRPVTALTSATPEESRIPTVTEKERLAHWRDALSPPDDMDTWFERERPRAPIWAYASMLIALGVGVLYLWALGLGPFAA